jgi:vacuolar-type H+-ATPase subunit I/STV1
MKEAKDLQSKWDFVLDSIKTKNPDLYDVIVDNYGEALKTYSNPIVDSRIEALESKIKELEGSRNDSQKQASEEHFVSSVKQFIQKTDPTVKGLGLEVDWNEVAQVAGGNPENIEKAFYLLHGGKLSSLYQSKMKLNQVKAKNNNVTKSTGVSGMKTAKTGKTDLFSQLKGKSINEIANSINSGRVTF